MSFVFSVIVYTKMSSFIAGDILKNSKKWADAIQWMETNGGFVPPLLKEAVKGRLNEKFFSYENFCFSNEKNNFRNPRVIVRARIGKDYAFFEYLSFAR